MAKILKCKDCGSIIEVLVEGDANACDSHMIDLPVQTEGDKAGKHKPVIEIDGDNVTVKIGEVTHPMEEEHFIQFVVVNVGNEQYAKCFKPGDVPEATFTVGADKLAQGVVAQEYCNVHGLWSSE